MSKILTDKEVLDLIGKEEEKRIASEIEKIDKDIFLFDIDTPDSLNKKIRATGINLKLPQKRKPFYKRIATVILIITLSGNLICLFNPNIVLAVKRAVLQIVSFQKKESLNINLYRGDNLLDKLELAPPSGFEKSNYIDDFNKQSVTYENEKGEFIKISIYPENFFLSFDNEDYQEYEDININDFSGKMIIKNDIVTILFFDNVSLFEVESNLSKEETLIFAESININYENE